LKDSISKFLPKHGNLCSQHFYRYHVYLWPNFGKSTILAHLTRKIFSSQKQPLNLKFYAMVGWIHSRYLKEGSQKYTKSILCSWQYQVKHKNSNCFMHDEMVDFPKFGHIYIACFAHIFAEVSTGENIKRHLCNHISNFCDRIRFVPTILFKVTVHHIFCFTLFITWCYVSLYSMVTFLFKTVWSIKTLPLTKQWWGIVTPVFDGDDGLLWWCLFWCYHSEHYHANQDHEECQKINDRKLKEIKKNKAKANGSKCILQVFAIELVIFAVDFVPLVVEFGRFCRRIYRACTSIRRLGNRIRCLCNGIRHVCFRMH